MTHLLPRIHARPSPASPPPRPELIAAKSKEIGRLNGVYVNLLKNAGVAYFEGKGSLVDAHTVKVRRRAVRARVRARALACVRASMLRSARSRGAPAPPGAAASSRKCSRQRAAARCRSAPRRQVTKPDGSEQLLRGKNVLIATGGYATKVPIEGAEHAITSDEALSLDSLPEKSILIVGSGCALAKASSMRAVRAVPCSVRGMLCPCLNAHVACTPRPCAATHVLAELGWCCS